MFKNALVSVSNKEGLVDLICPLARQGMRVVSTGGTSLHLQKAGISVVEVSQQTGFEEVMDGRVKSLHPSIYIPLLARLNKKADVKVLKDRDLAPFDLVVCNLYPFKDAKHQGKKDLVEWIDVGGPSLLRAAAKNFEHVTVLCDPEDYQGILDAGEIPSLEKRKQLAGKVFSMLADYNFCIADEMQKESQKERRNLYLKGRFYTDLRYGENPGQKANWFQLNKTGLHQALCLQGKELSFNNICDLDSAVSTVREFREPCCVAVKHNNPCGVACDSQMETAIGLALKADPVSVFGAVIATNRPISEEAAQILSSLFLEAAIAPDYSDSALAVFKSKKKNLRIMKWPDLSIYNNNQKEGIKNQFDIHCVDGGLLVQDTQNINKEWQKDWKYIGQKPGSSVQSELLMAWKVCAHLKSNAVALVSGNQTVGLGMGQVNRISSVEIAIQKWKSFHSGLSIPVMASDGFFPFPDSIEAAAHVGIKWIIQPGGSLRDQEVISKAQSLSVNMVFTGQRCFSH
ncbi:MAG: bifunctional phosphoribosylaminoimidazolecarboxamide formyltransferase/IMP cyclohydrolase, partial [Oligoflexia bacterium]|nr:bifunctional phosphoribosylaminoimidazolecarboxamide formyltransferase/IMP cyclohydrolase [Oligoflexia bacterium]